MSALCVIGSMACRQLSSESTATTSIWPGPVPPLPPPPAPRVQVTTFLAFGDSLTEGYLKGSNADRDSPTPTAIISNFDPATPGPVTGYPYKLWTRLSARYTTQTIAMYDGGVGGRQARADVQDDRIGFLLPQLPVRPDVLILMEGVNDLNAGATIASTIAALQALVNEGLARGMRVLVSTLPPETPGGIGPGTSVVLAYNTALKNQIASATIVDIYPAISQDMIGPDGLHLLEVGNQTLANVYFAKIVQLYELQPEAAFRTTYR